MVQTSGYVSLMMTSLHYKMVNTIVFNHTLKSFIKKGLSTGALINHPAYRRSYERKIDYTISNIRKPATLRIENTAFCNASCAFCPHSSMTREKGIMSDDLFQKLIGEAQKIGIEHVSIHGFGEPFLDSNFLKKVTFAKKAGIKKVTTNTNALLLNTENGRSMINSGLDEIYISHNAASGSTFQKITPKGSFKVIEDNIKNLSNLRKKSGNTLPRIYLSYVLSPENINEVDHYLSKWKKMVDGISISNMHNWGNDIHTIDSMGSPRDPCKILWSDLNVYWDGSIPLCCNDYDGRVIIGRAGKDSIFNIWSSDRLRQIRELHRKREFKSISLCASCSFNNHDKSPWWF